MSNLFDSLRDRLIYARAYRGVAHSLSSLTRRELDDIGVDCVASTAHESAMQGVSAAKARRAEKRAERDLAAVRDQRNELYGVSRG